jgi:Fatty acid/phospholipid biosynthesis enzyme
MPSIEHIIAIDAMGGDNSPDKIIEGISLFLKEDKIFF